MKRSREGTEAHRTRGKRERGAGWASGRRERDGRMLRGEDPPGQRPDQMPRLCWGREKEATKRRLEGATPGNRVKSE